jgi:hypothetical protein
MKRRAQRRQKCGERAGIELNNGALRYEPFILNALAPRDQFFKGDFRGCKTPRAGAIYFSYLAPDGRARNFHKNAMYEEIKKRGREREREEKRKHIHK